MIQEAEDLLNSQTSDDSPEDRRTSGQIITQGLLQHIPSIVETCGATVLFVYVDALEDWAVCQGLSVKARVFCVTKAPAAEMEARLDGVKCLRVPNVPLTRIGQVKIAIFLALSRGLIRHGERVVFVSGLAAAKTLDTVIVTEVGREYEIFPSGAEIAEDSSRILPEVLERAVDLASELGSEGREGKPVGALFVIGDTEHVLPLTRQLVLNPFKGYSPDERNILDYSLEETVKELATLDGAFIIRGDGVMETCGTYLRTAGQEEFELPRGLGARHHAAAAITAVTGAIAVTVSESTGSITIFRRGRIVTEIQKPRSTRDKSRLRAHKHRHHDL